MWGIADQSVHLWWADGRQCAPSDARWLDCLNDAEQQALQGKVPSLQERRLFAKVFVKSLLAQYLDRAPRDLSFTYNAFGKPSLVDAPLAFNLSHSGHYLALALTVTGTVGVDLQAFGSARQPSAVAARFFHPTEHQWLQSLPQAWQPTYFYRLWAAKEAVLKAAGIGIGATGLKDVVFSKPTALADALSIDREVSAQCLSTFQLQECFWLNDAALSLATCQAHTDLQTFLWQGKLAA